MRLRHSLLRQKGVAFSRVSVSLDHVVKRIKILHLIFRCRLEIHRITYPALGKNFTYSMLTFDRARLNEHVARDVTRSACGRCLRPRRFTIV